MSFSKKTTTTTTTTSVNDNKDKILPQKRKKNILDSDEEIEKENECDSCGEENEELFEDIPIKTKKPVAKKVQTKRSNKTTVDPKQPVISKYFTAISGDSNNKIIDDSIKIKEEEKYINKFNSSKKEKLDSIKIGAHMSIVPSISSLIERAIQRGFKAIAFFTNTPRTWKQPKLKEGEADRFKAACKKYEFSTKYIMPHGSYFLNLGSPESDKLAKSRDLLLHELQTCEELGISLYNFHPGSHLKLISEEESLKVIAESINLAISKTKSVILVIECTAGQGSNLGYKFEHLRDIIELVDNKERVGVCLDTCHMFAGGYDLTTKNKCEKVFQKFDEIVGFKYLKGIHLNDSKNVCNSRLDRHENIGKGYIGENCFKFLVNDSRFHHIPMILETEGDHIQEVQQLYNYIEDETLITDEINQNDKNNITQNLENRDVQNK